MTRNGLAIVEVTDVNSRAMFIDEDALKLAMLNKMTRERRERAKMERRRIEHEQRMIAYQRKMWRDYTVDTFSYIVVRVAIMGGSIWAAIVGMMHPIISIPVSVFCFGAACIRFGVWFGKANRC